MEYSDIHSAASSAKSSASICMSEPLPPVPEACCGSGCAHCVNDIYEQERRIYLRKCAERASDVVADTTGLLTLSPDAYSLFAVVQMEVQKGGCYLFTFQAVSSPFQLDIGIGQHLILRGTVDGASIVRPYTPVDCSPGSCSFQVFIKIYTTGLMSSYVRTWSVGTVVEWRGPIGGFLYTPNQASKLIMLAAGTGIAPLVRLIESILDDEDDETRMVLMYGCKTQEDILMQSRVRTWQKYWNFSVCFFLSEEQLLTDRLPYGMDAVEGRITKEALSAELFGGRIRILVCGSKAFNATMLSYAEELGTERSQVHVF